MGTRGHWGYIIDGEEKVAYCHWDAYPSGLGEIVLRHLRETDLDVLREQVKALRLVSDDVPPTEDEQEGLRRFANTNVSSGNLGEWYVLLRETQGDPALTLEAGVMEDGRSTGDGEYAYVVDFDRGVFEVRSGDYSGGHTHTVANFPLDDLPSSLTGVEA
jgi:hypothetical protein